jgi:hypothetical protein
MKTTKIKMIERIYGLMRDGLSADEIVHELASIGWAVSPLHLAVGGWVPTLRETARAEASLTAVAAQPTMIAQPVQQQQGRAPRVMFTMEQVTEAMSEDSGFCIKCGGQTDDTVEPDARGYRCPHCDAMAVYGAEELLIMGRVA